MGTYKWSFPSGMVNQINSGKINLTPTYSSPYETDGAFDVKVVNGATAAVYTITCNTESCETTGTLTIKDCSGGGGGCSDITINIKETVTELTKDGGELVFKHGTVPEPTPVGDCVTSRDWTASYLKNTSLNTIFDTASQCCDENDNWKASGSITIKIVNNSDYYIPFNGEFKWKNPDGKDIEHHFRLPSTTVSASESHYWYGRYSNFFVPPNTTVTLENCQGTTPLKTTGEYHFYLSVLRSTDIDADANHIEGHTLHAEDISVNTNDDKCECRSSVNGNTITFTIPQTVNNGKTRWRGNNITNYYGQTGDFYYGLTLDEIRNNHCSRFAYKNGDTDKTKLVPVYLNSDADWSAIEIALTTKNSNNYYPYVIT